MSQPPLIATSERRQGPHLRQSRRRRTGPALAELGIVTARPDQDPTTSDRTVRVIHEGRFQIEEALLNRARYYKQRRNYEPTLERRYLDDFLVRAVRRQQLADMNALYNLVLGGQMTRIRWHGGLSPRNWLLPW